jgi:hypothetical protein
VDNDFFSSKNPSLNSKTSDESEIDEKLSNDSIDLANHSEEYQLIKEGKSFIALELMIQMELC